MDELYRQVLLEHYKKPKNFGSIQNPDVKHKESNPTCGDVIEMYLSIKDEKVTDIKFQGSGCVICMASASMLTEFLQDKTINEIKKLDRDNVMDIINIELDHVRIKCATLSLHAVKNGLNDYK